MKVFLSGIGGTGMSALAGLFSEFGFEVSGSDTLLYPPVDKILANMGVQVKNSFDPANIDEDVDFCVVGNVISRGNPELEYILASGIEFYSMSEALYQFFIKGNKAVVVAGTHGKTTITAFISYLLIQAGLNPGYFIGGKPIDLPTNYALGGGSYFVIEGDEYETSFFDRSSKFLKYHANTLVLTALEFDHADFFTDEDQYLRSFKNLVNQVPANGLIITHSDYDMNGSAVGNSFTPVIGYGTMAGDYRIAKVCMLNENGYLFSIIKGSEEYRFQTSIPGRYNIENLCAGIIFGLHIGIPPNTISEAVRSFKGVARRLQLINKIKSTLFMEDFAHHPTAIAQTLASIKEIYPQRRLICLFEPRSWSLRLNLFQDKLAESFNGVDQLIIKEVYQKEKIPPEKRLDIHLLKSGLEDKGIEVAIMLEYDQIKEFIQGIDFNQETMVILISNGAFGQLPDFIRQLKG